MKAFGNHPGMFRYQGGVAVSTFMGEHLRFGQQTLDNAWEYVKRTLEEIAPVSPKVLCPVLAIKFPHMHDRSTLSRPSLLTQQHIRQ